MDKRQLEQIIAEQLESIEKQWHSSRKRIVHIVENYNCTLDKDVQRLFEDILHEIPNFVEQCHPIVSLGLYPSSSRVYEYATEVATLVAEQCSRMIENWEVKILKVRFANEVETPLSIIADELTGLMLKVVDLCSDFSLGTSCIQDDVEKYSHFQRIDIKINEAFDKFMNEVRIIGLSKKLTDFRFDYIPPGDMINQGIVFPPFYLLNRLFAPMALKKEIDAKIVESLIDTLTTKLRQVIIEMNELYSRIMSDCLLITLNEYETCLHTCIQKLICCNKSL